MSTMFRRWKSLLIGVAVAAMVLTAATEANAHWGWGGWGGYRPAVWSCAPACSPCYTVTCDPCGSGGTWYVGWRPGPIRRFLFGPCRWNYSGACCPVGSCCSLCCETDCCGEVTVTGSTSAGVPTRANKEPVDDGAAAAGGTEGKSDAAPPAENGDSAPPEGDGAQKYPEPPAIPKTGQGAPPSEDQDDAGGVSGDPVTYTRENSGLLTIWVPYDAKVYINGIKTQSKGSRREYVSHGLQPGLNYRYEIRATVVRNDQLVEERRTAALMAGESQGVAFGFIVGPPVGGLVAR